MLHSGEFLAKRERAGALALALAWAGARGPRPLPPQPAVDELAEEPDAERDAVRCPPDRRAVQRRDRAVGVGGQRDDRVARRALVVAEAGGPPLGERRQLLIA